MIAKDPPDADCCIGPFIFFKFAVFLILMPRYNWDAVKIQYGEIALKGGNRGRFENLLFLNIKNMLPAALGLKLKKKYGRFVLESTFGEEEERLIRASLVKIFGIANFSFAKRTPLDLEALKIEAANLVASASGGSFKIATVRPNKQFPLTSMEISAQVGGYVAKKSGKKVDVSNPDIVCAITIAEKEAYLGIESIIGPGGLPVGISGNLLALLSGGIDSPVASWKMMRRGASVDFIHFHSYPYTNRSSIEKVKDLAHTLTSWQGGGTLYFVPFIDIQKEIMIKVEARYRVLLYRRFMLRIAEELARKNKAQALVTGESLGQVASQTIENITSVEAVSSLPILRPLIGENKDDIIEVAKKINTFEISIRPHEDCCTLFVPKNPATKSRAEDLARKEVNLSVEELVKNAIDKIEKIIL